MNARLLLIFLTGAMLASFAAAAAEKSLGSFGAWNAFSYDQNGQTVCYMVTTKTLKSSGPQKRAGPYLMITHRPTEGSTDVVSYGAGTLLDSRRDVTISAGKASFDLFSARDIAWARDAQTDHRLAAAIRNAATAQAKAVPAKHGAKGISDTFDVKGAAAAYHAIGKACGLPDDTPKKAAPKKTVPKKPAKKAVTNS